MTTERDRITRLEAIVKQIERRLESIGHRLTALEGRIIQMWASTLLALIAIFVTLMVTIVART